VRQAGNPTHQLWSLQKMRFRYTLMQLFSTGASGDTFWDAENQCKEDIFWDAQENQIIGVGSVQAFGPGWDEKKWTERGETVTTTLRNTDGQFVGVLFCRSTVLKSKNGYTLQFWIDKAVMTTHHEVVFCRHSWIDSKGELDNETSSSPPSTINYTIRSEALPDAEELRSYLQAGMIVVEMRTFSTKYASVEQQELERLDKQLEAKTKALVAAEIQINFLNGDYDDLENADAATLEKLQSSLGSGELMHLQEKKVKREYTDVLPNQKAVRRFYNRKDVQLFLGLVILFNFIVSLVEAEVGDNYDGAYVVEVSFNVFFLAELIVNFYGSFFARFVNSFSNIFDALIVVGSLASMFMDFGGVTVLRCFRLARVTRLFARNASLQKIVIGISRSVSGMAATCFILVLVMCIWAIIGVETFGDEPEFATFSQAMLTMLQVCTMDGWSEISRKVREKYGTIVATGYFVSILIVGGIVMLNLLTVVLFERYITALESEESFVLNKFFPHKEHDGNKKDQSCVFDPMEIFRYYSRVSNCRIFI
jgi:hypothetical protein